MIKGFYTQFITMGITVVAICTTLWSCAPGGGKQPAGEKQSTFTHPEVPVVLQSPQERATYLVVHFWDNFNFADTTIVRNAEVTEQAFVNYINFFPHVTADVLEKSVSEMLNKAITADNAMFDHFSELYEKYLYDPNSPFRQEDFYIAVLRSIVANDKVDELNKIRPRYQLEMALKNRPGAPATDFEYVLANGQISKLSSIKAEYTTVLFYNPGCGDCTRVEQYIATSPTFTQLQQNKALTILAVYTEADIDLWRKHLDYLPKNWTVGYDKGEKITQEELYDLRAIPCLYLLDAQKRVILKDAPVEQIEAWFTMSQKPGAER